MKCNWCKANRKAHHYSFEEYMPLNSQHFTFYLLYISFAGLIYNPKLKHHIFVLPNVKPSSFSALLETNKKLPNANLDHKLVMATYINEIKRLHFFQKGIDIAETILSVFTVSAVHLCY